ncbi:FIG00432887: hypothetical protein [Achromobacter xylosoxidans NH44784-1996]|uniref:hypothetical protein n=1 Tax=Alcaligenes xylosoxydans xylosoxydans TaxID=85698 RepID=UPI000332416E|nr:hypothetical protein [Achromobacter xylosoxidans]CCH04057.1 FIG00432887: hypothetical protein [Achromobacter xylosoxidans NH44784-1996]
MNDREMLELAAKAAGLEGSYLFQAGGKKGSGFPYDLEGIMLTGGAMWNPLKTDGDALRLAVKLGIDIESYSDTVAADGIHEPRGVDDYKATRRAIVRAAAEIGKEM